MPILWTSINARDHLSQPQSTRWRHRFRGQRESYKTNVETSQMLFDLRRLYEKMNAIEESFDANVETLEIGSTITVVDAQMEGAALGEEGFPLLLGGGLLEGETTLSVEGLDDLLRRAERLRQRVYYLENN